MYRPAAGVAGRTHVQADLSGELVLKQFAVADVVRKPASAPCNLKGFDRVSEAFERAAAEVYEFGLICYQSEHRL